MRNGGFSLVSLERSICDVNVKSVSTHKDLGREAVFETLEQGLCTCGRKRGGVSEKHKEDHCMEKLPIISPNLSLGLLTLFMVPIVIQTFQNFDAIK